MAMFPKGISNGQGERFSLFRMPAKTIVERMDRRLGLSLDFNPQMKGKLIGGVSSLSSLKRGIVAEMLGRDRVSIDGINFLIRSIGFKINKVGVAFRVEELDRGSNEGDSIMYARSLAAAEGILPPGIELNGGGGLSHLQFMSSENSGGGGRDLLQTQRDVFTVIETIVGMRGRDAKFTGADVSKAYLSLKGAKIDEGDLARVLVSIEKLLWIESVPRGTGEYVIYNQAKKIQGITDNFMAEADRPGNTNLYSLIQLFAGLMHSVYENVDFYLYNDSGKNEVLLIERTTGRKEDSQYYPDWHVAGKTRKELTKLFVTSGVAIKKIDPETDETFIDGVSVKKDANVFIDPSGPFLSGLSVVPGGRDILAAVNFSNKMPKAEFAGEDMRASIIGDEINPPLYGRFDDEASVNSALNHLFSQMAIRMRRLIENSGYDDIRSLLENTKRPAGQMEGYRDVQGSLEGLKGLLERSRGVASRKTFRSREGEKVISVKVTSINKPMRSLDRDDAVRLGKLLDNTSIEAWSGKKGLSVSGYGTTFVVEHFLSVDKLLVATDRAVKRLVAFAGLNKKAFEIVDANGARVSRLVHVLESVMVLPDYQEYSIGSYLTYKLFAESLVEFRAKGERGPIKFILRTANPRAFGGLWRAFDDRLYPNPMRPLIDPQNASPEERELLQISQAASEHINPGKKFDPETGVVKEVYSEESGMRLGSDCIQWDKDEKVNDFFRKYLFGAGGGNSEGNAFDLYLEGDESVRKQYQSTKGINLAQRIQEWFLWGLSRIGRKST